MLNLKLNTRFSNYNTKVLAVAFLVALITILVYLPALQNGFVSWDDPKYVYENQYIQSIDFKFFKWMFTTFYAANWHPLTWLSHAIDYAIWGLKPMGHHLTSIIFHGLNTFLVVLVITRLVSFVRRDVPAQIRNQLIAGAVTGLLFGLHPLHVESVAWVSERKDVLCAFFFLLSILSYLKYTSSLHPFDKLRTGGIYYGLCLLFFTMALMSKPMAVTLPVVLIILDFYPLERLDFKSVFTSQRKVLIEKLPFMVLSLASSVITVMAQQSGGAIQSLDAHPLGVRFLVGIRALCFYLIKMLLPTNLAPLYPYPSKISFLTSQYIGAFILVVCITAFCIWSWKRQKLFSAIWAYYIVTLLPVLGIIQVGAQSAADRYTYLPGLAPFLLAGLGVAFVWRKVVKKHRSKFKILFVFIPLILILIFLASTTVNQIKIWKNSVTLWNTELKMFPNFYMAYKSRGEAYSNLDNHPQAIIDYDKAIKLNPFYAEIYFDRGISYAELGNYQKAIEDFNMAITISPDYVDAYVNRGISYLMMGNFKHAILDFNKSIDMDPQNKRAYSDRILAYKLAIKDYSKAIKQHPQNYEFYIDRGVYLAMTGQFDKALEDFNKVISLNPQLAIAYYNRGLTYNRLGKHNQAIKDFQTAARLGNKKAQNYLISKGMKW